MSALLEFQEECGIAPLSLVVVPPERPREEFLREVALFLEDLRLERTLLEKAKAGPLVDEAPHPAVAAYCAMFSRLAAELDSVTAEVAAMRMVSRKKRK